MDDVEGLVELLVEVMGARDYPIGDKIFEVMRWRDKIGEERFNDCVGDAMDMLGAV